MWRLGRNMGWHVISIFAMHLDESPMTYGNPSIDAWGRSVDSMQLNKAVWVPLVIATANFQMYFVWVVLLLGF